MDDFRAHTHLRGDGSADTFVAAVDAQQMRTLATDAQHECSLAAFHPVVLIGDAALQRRHHCVCRAPSR